MSHTRTHNKVATSSIFASFTASLLRAFNLHNPHSARPKRNAYHKCGWCVPPMGSSVRNVPTANDKNILIQTKKHTTNTRLVGCSNALSRRARSSLLITCCLRRTFSAATQSYKVPLLSCRRRRRRRGCVVGACSDVVIFRACDPVNMELHKTRAESRCTLIRTWHEYDFVHFARQTCARFDAHDTNNSCAKHIPKTQTNTTVSAHTQLIKSRHHARHGIVAVLKYSNANRILHIF